MHRPLLLQVAVARHRPRTGEPVLSGSIYGSLSRGWCRHRRCFPLHTQDRTNNKSWRVATTDRPRPAPGKLRNTRGRGNLRYGSERMSDLLSDLGDQGVESPGKVVRTMRTDSRIHIERDLNAAMAKMLLDVLHRRTRVDQQARCRRSQIVWQRLNPRLFRRPVPHLAPVRVAQMSALRIREHQPARIDSFLAVHPQTLCHCARKNDRPCGVTSSSVARSVGPCCYSRSRESSLSAAPGPPTPTAGQTPRQSARRNSTGSG